MTEPRMDPRRLARIINRERALAIESWLKIGLDYVQISRYAATWDSPNESSPFYGLASFGEDCAAQAGKILGRTLPPPRSRSDDDGAG